MNLESFLSLGLTNILRIETEVRARFQSRKLGQFGWITVEVCDVITDFGAFAAYTAVCAETENYDALFYSYLLLVIVTVPAFVNNVAIRLKIVSQYNDVLDGGETVAAYAKVLYTLKAEDGAINGADEMQIGVDNLALRLELVNIDIVVTDLGMKSAVLEDFPSIVINGLVLLGVLGPSSSDDKDFKLLAFAVGSLLCSAAIGGRKMALPSQRNFLLWEK